VGENSSVLTKYFEANGAHKCPPESNPAEWMLEVIGAAPGTQTDVDWHETWKNSPEAKAVRDHLAELKENRPKETADKDHGTDKSSYKEFAATLPVQMVQVTKRVFQQLWRTPSYIYSKTALCVGSSLFIGFRCVTDLVNSILSVLTIFFCLPSFFKQPLSSQGLQNQMFSFFLLLTIFGQLAQQ
jgi:ATP-binding cassette subfamily G (WHITE) protein 2 (PDR)